MFMRPCVQSTMQIIEYLDKVASRRDHARHLNSRQAWNHAFVELSFLVVYVVTFLDFGNVRGYYLVMIG